MKKFFMIAVMAVAALSANAQYAPAKGDFSLAVKFNPFATANSSNEVSTFEGADKYAVAGRYMLTDKDAIRATVGFNYENQSVKANGVEYDKTRTTALSLKVGYERHFAANDRIDLYAGGQVGMAFDWNRGYDSMNGEEAYYVKSGDTEINAGVFTGINFYVYKKLYLGAEVGFNFSSGWNHDKTYDDPTKVTDDSRATTTKLGFKVEPSLLLGWTF